MVIRECPICGSARVRRHRGNVKRRIAGKTRTLRRVAFWECQKCGERFYPADSVHKMERQLGRTSVATIHAKA